MHVKSQSELDIGGRETCSQLSLPVLDGQVGDLVWNVYVSVPNPVSIRGSTKYIAPY